MTKDRKGKNFFAQYEKTKTTQTIIPLVIVGNNGSICIENHIIGYMKRLIAVALMLFVVMGAAMAQYSGSVVTKSYPKILSPISVCCCD